MPKKKSDKKIECFSSSFDDILICQKNVDRPYMEVFVSEPENVAQQNLGTLAGILEITDSSEESSYIVNYLVSVIKKEYYSRAKRGTIESFEAALKKANLALAKLAEHETVAWIGHTNAILLVIDKNNLHLSTSGDARALLLRGKTLTDISDGGVTEEAPNPIKTFTDIVSGRLEEADKLIITTSAMFDIFSFEEIKKSALKFSSTQFIQFLKTALVNELERAAALIIEVKKEEKIATSPTSAKKNDNFNAFSQTAFSKKKTPAKTVPASPNDVGQKDLSEAVALETPAEETSAERQRMVAEIKEELAKNKEDFVDKKTGHIYIKENYPSLQEESPFLEKLALVMENLALFFAGSARKMHRFSASLSEKIRTINWSNIFKKRTRRDDMTDSLEIAQKITQPDLPSTEKHIPVQKIPDHTKVEEAESRIMFFWKENYPKLKTFSLAVMTQLVRFMQSVIRTVLQKTEQSWRAGKIYWTDRQRQKEKRNTAIHIRPAVLDEIEEKPVEKRDWMEKYSEKLSGPMTENVGNAEMSYETKPFKKVLPRVSRLKNILGRLDYTQKIYVALALVLIFIVPYFLAKIGRHPAPVNVTTEKPVTVAMPLAEDKNVIRIDNLSSVYSGENISGVINLNGSFFAISKNGVINIANSANYPLPENFQPKLSVGMDDLNLLFILGQDNRIISWSPINNKFQDNSIVFPDSANIVSIGTYLTYLYALDSQSGQIYRYPRADGGFGDKVNWLKNASDSAGMSSMTVSDNIYLGNNTNLDKFFQGKKQDFTLETTATPIKIDALFTKRDDQFIYLLDKAAARIVKIDLNGQIISQYYNPGIKNATNFTVDEANNLIYVSLPDGVSSFGIDQGS